MTAAPARPPEPPAAGFAGGFVTGALTAGFSALLVLYGLGATGQVRFTGPLTLPETLAAWVYRNLGLSLPVFAVVALMFAYTLLLLRRRLQLDGSLNEVAQADHLADIWVSVFFGVGVIWTAIGMRNALLFALGDPEATMQAGAFALLQRMVDGGILVALSTTIFGGVGGYLMRVVKTVSIGNELKRYYAGRADAETSHTRTTLTAMERHLRTLAAGRSETTSDAADV